ncbi:MAG TPA: hypothetical protein DCG54_02730, partial [Anaerolineae bacterium]|nr:hypothetical protein [Anaerolineae bacterium]
MNNSRNQSFMIYALLFIAIIAMVFFQMQQRPVTEEVLTINELAAQIEQGEVKRILVENDNRLRVIYSESGAEVVERSTQ